MEWFENKEVDYVFDFMKKTKEELVNEKVNDMIANISDYSPNNKDPHGHGKRIPYIGWYWRSIDMFNNNVFVGDCGDFIGVMQNNKWGYPERKMTNDEYKELKERLFQILSFWNGWGNIGENFRKTDNLAEELWAWMQTLEI